MLFDSIGGVGRWVLRDVAVAAAHAAVIVALPDAASYATLPKIMSLIKQYCSRRKKFLGYLLLINQVDRVKQLADDVTDMMSAKFGKKSIVLIHQDQAIPEALAYSKRDLEFQYECWGIFSVI